MQSLNQQRIHSIQDYISIHLDEKLSLKKLAGLSSLSPYHFHRLFKEITGEPLNQFIARLRMERACAMLSSPGYVKIIQIGMDCGFSTPSAFSKAFRRHKGMSPSQYRDIYLSTDFQTFGGNSKMGTSKGKGNKDNTPSMEYISDQELEKQLQWRKKMNVTIKELPGYSLAYLRQIGPYGPNNLQLMQRLKQWAVSRNLIKEGTVILGIAQDDPQITPANKCRYDCGIVVKEDFLGEDGINRTTLPGGLYALFSVEHTGEAIQQKWEEIMGRWLPQSQYRMDGRPVFERYSRSHGMEKLSPELCEICIPLEKI